MIKRISAKELRFRFTDVLKAVHKRSDRYIITRRGHSEVVIMSVEDYESILETMEIQSDKSFMQRIKNAEKEIKSKKGTPIEKVREEIGLV